MGDGFPLAACLVRNYIAEAITPGIHGSTYGGIISEVRGEGLLIGIELKAPFADKIVSRSLDKGLIMTKVLNNRVVRIAPPLVVHDKHVDAACDTLCNSFFEIKGAEVGLTSISRSRINKLKLEGDKRAKIIDRLLSKKELTIGTMLR